MRLARRRVALDPLSEGAQRELIRRLAAAGDRSGAMTAYIRLRERLRRDLGIAPSIDTRRLVEQVRADDGAEILHAELAGEGLRTPPRGRPHQLLPLPPLLHRAPPTALVGRTDGRGRGLVNLTDLVAAKRHPDFHLLNGCCGLDGCDGPNLVCARGHQ